MHYAMRDVKDMGQQMGYRSLEWNWPKEAIIIIIIEGLSLLQSIPPTTANKQTQAQKKGGAGLESCYNTVIIIIIKGHSLRRACLQPACY